ncbi:MAG: glutaredoxin family protein [Pseudomonadales bacterium]
MPFIEEPLIVAEPLLTLLTTDQCTLCDRALDMLLSMPELRGVALRTVDVVADEALLERYGARLPVLVGPDGELDWPFDRAAVAALVGVSR